MTTDKTKNISSTLKESIVIKLEELAKREGISRSLALSKILEKELPKYLNEEKNLFNFDK